MRAKGYTDLQKRMAAANRNVFIDIICNQESPLLTLPLQTIKGKMCFPGLKQPSTGHCLSMHY